MRRKMHISKTGLKLIKAYEGFRPVDRHLVNGHHVVGYGHIIEGDDSLVLTRAAAEELLLSDLEPYEDMVNETVHAPLSQNQFDALVSLAFNIGPRAFTQSDTLRALNNGRPLDAASGFDIWRKSTIDGKIYVVDALMRRRAAEKALFLRMDGEKTLPASRADLPPVKDEMVALLTTEDALPVISKDARNGLVARVPYDAADMAKATLEEVAQAAEQDASSYVTVAAPEVKITQNDAPVTYARRREDGPSGILELSEVYEDGVERERSDDDLVDATYEVDDFDYEEVEIDAEALIMPYYNLAVEGLDDDKTADKSPSLIATTASQLSDRLDALIDDVAGDDAAVKAEKWPETLIQASDEEDNVARANIETLPETDKITDPDITNDKGVDIVIDDLAADDAFRERTDSAAKYINIEPPEASETAKEGRGYFIPLLIAMCLVGASLGAIFRDPTDILGEWGPLLSFIGLVVGVIMTLSMVYYGVKTKKPL